MVVIWFGAWTIIFLYWLVPALTELVFMLYFRLSAEHFVLAEDAIYRIRTIIPAWWEKLIFSPVNINYLLAHHLFPMVPYYHLPELHARLMKIPQFRNDAHIVNGYTNGFLKECLGLRRRSGAINPQKF